MYTFNANRAAGRDRDLYYDVPNYSDHADLIRRLDAISMSIQDQSKRRDEEMAQHVAWLKKEHEVVAAAKQSPPPSGEQDEFIRRLEALKATNEEKRIINDGEVAALRQEIEASTNKSIAFYKEINEKVDAMQADVRLLKELVEVLAELKEENKEK